MSVGLISIVVPAYNRSATLATTIASVLAQTHAGFELIVVDDASVDGTADVVLGCADPRIRYLRNERNLGVSATRNRGVEAARSEWIAFLDSDDDARPQRLERQLQAVAGADDVVLVLCGDHVVNEPSMSLSGFADAGAVFDATAQVYRRIPGASCWLVRRSALLEAGGFDPTLDCFEDWELAMRLAQHGRVLMVNQPLVDRRRTPGSLFSAEERYARNMKVILQRHGERLRGEPAVWAFYCNMIGQCECQYGSATEGRRWFARALAAHPWAPRSWLNFAASVLGRAGFRVYVRGARNLRSRFAAPVRPRLSS